MPENSEMDSSNEKKSDAIDIQRYRALVKQFIDIRRYKTALFWAEKVCVMTNYKTEDIYTLAHCFFLLKEYHRTAHTIRLHGLEKTHIPSYNLLLESLYEGKEYEEALSVINAYDIECWPSSTLNQNTEVMDNDASMVGAGGVPKHEVLASIMLIKGKIFEATDNRGLAMDYYVQALHKSVYCYEALDALVKHEMLMAWEEKELLRHLPLVQQSSAPDAKLLSTLYQSKLKKYHESLLSMSEKEKCPISKNVKAIREIKEQVNKNVSDGYLHKDSFSQAFNKSNLSSPSFNSFKKVLSEFRNSPFSLQMSLSRVHSIINESQRSNTDSPRASKQQKQADGKTVLALDVCLKRILQSTDIMASEAEKLFYKCYYNQAMKILEQLLKVDPFHEAALTLQIGCYVEFGDFNKLFYTAHKLVDRYPDKAISWYAVGCYYDLIGKSDPARRFLSKATTLDRLFGPAWLAYGHSFAKENEHDQAMAAYFKATQLMRGCHLPLLYIGVECGLTKNLNLAEKFFYQAMSVAALDVFVMHELGVIKYEYQFYENAEEVFRATADVVKYRAKLNKEEVAPRWEPLFNNLGHCLRKNKKYKEAIEYHQMALLLKPQSAQTYTALGFAYALMEDYEEAITYFHKSLAINRDCIVTSTILKNCIEDQMTQTDIICDIMDKSLSLNKSPKSTAKTAPKRLPSTNESPPSHGSMKFNRTEEDASMTQTEMEMSMETQ